MPDHQQIGLVARELGINPKTIRYYEESGLIPEAARTPQVYRVYFQGEIDRISFILRARALDFSLEDIGEIMAFRERGELENLQPQAETLPPETLANKDCICHLIENQALKEQQI